MVGWIGFCCVLMGIMFLSACVLYIRLDSPQGSTTNRKTLTKNKDNKLN